MGFPEHPDYVMTLPDGLAGEEAFATYSRTNLVKDGFKRGQLRPQFWGHRGAIKFPDFGDNWLVTFVRAVDLGAGGIEADLQQIGLEQGKDAIFVSVHDRNGERIFVGLPKFFNMCKPDEVIGRPIVVPQIRNERRTGKFYVTNETVSGDVEIDLRRLR